MPFEQGEAIPFGQFGTLRAGLRPCTAAGYLMEEGTRRLLCGDLFTQGGADNPAVTESDILGPSEAFPHGMDYFSHTKNARQMLERLASTGATTLACMHGSAWRGDGAKLLRALADALCV